MIGNRNQELWDSESQIANRSVRSRVESQAQVMQDTAMMKAADPSQELLCANTRIACLEAEITNRDKAIQIRDALLKTKHEEILRRCNLGRDSLHHGGRNATPFSLPSPVLPLQTASNGWSSRPQPAAVVQAAAHRPSITSHCPQAASDVAALYSMHSPNDCAISSRDTIVGQLHGLMNSPLCDIDVRPASGDLHHWLARINSSNDSALNGGKIDLAINFPAEYPFRPPQVQFITGTKVLHRRVTANGQVRVAWAPQYSISSVLCDIRDMISTIDYSDGGDGDDNADDRDDDELPIYIKAHGDAAECAQLI